MAVLEIDVNLELVRLQTRASLGDLALAGEWSAKAVVHTIGPVRGRHCQHELDDLFLVEMLTERVEVYIVDTPWQTCQQVTET
jgi:hypothetical protein